MLSGETDLGYAADLWATMLDLIYSGHAKEAYQFLDQAWPPSRAGKETFVSEFRAQLARSPYQAAIASLEYPRDDRATAESHP